jgi:hypothetical protein
MSSYIIRSAIISLGAAKLHLLEAFMHNICNDISLTGKYGGKGR